MKDSQNKKITNKKITNKMIKDIYNSVNNLTDEFNKKNLNSNINLSTSNINKQIHVIIKNNVELYNINEITYDTLMDKIHKGVDYNMKEYIKNYSKIVNKIPPPTVARLQPRPNNYIANMFKLAILSLIIFVLFKNKDKIISKILTEYNKQTTVIKILSISICIYILLYSIVYAFMNKYLYNNAIHIIDNPININYEEYLLTQEEIYKIDPLSSINSYSISLWFYIDAHSTSKDEYKTILSYGNNPKIEYNILLNNIRVVVHEQPNYNEKIITNNNQDNQDTYKDKDKYGNTIVFSTPLYKRQYWNNLVITLDKGVMDIFLNGKLSQTQHNILPEESYNSMYSGENNGIYGELCNVKYYTIPLTPTKIYRAYNILKNQSIPILM
jgi:hypothetical protein